MRVRCEAVVSIQRSTAANAVDGHLTWGVLVDRDRVVVPSPLEWLHDPSVRFEVLLASARGDGRGVVERIPVDQAEVHGLREHQGRAVAVLQLTYPSRHRPIMSRGYDPEEFVARLTDGGDVWTALEEVGALPADVRSRSVPEVLGRVAQWESYRRRYLVRDRLTVNPAQEDINVCCWLPCGRPCEDCPDPWR